MGPKSGWEQSGFVHRTRKAKRGDGKGIMLDSSSGEHADLVG
jgi:hypothetical protein